MKGTSEALSRVLNAAEIRVTYKKGQTLRSTLVHLKDKLPVDRTTNCLYKIKCTDCRAAYIGQTARELNTRVSEHKRRIGKRPRNMEDYNKLVRDSAIAEHALDTGHAVDLDNVKVIRRGLRSTSERLLAEAVEITKCKEAINRVEGVEIPLVWRTALQRR